MLTAVGVNSGIGRLRSCWYSSGGGGVRFYPIDPPAMSGRGPVRYLHRFRFGDTYQLKSRSWLLPQFLSGALILCGVILTLVGIICLQINKYLRTCDSDDGIHCKNNQANINNVMMPIGVGSTGGGLTLILISGFIFVHAFCVIYDDTEHQEEAQQGVLHIPTSLARDAFSGSVEVLPPPPPTTTTTPPPQLEVLPLEMPPLGTPSPDAEVDADVNAVLDPDASCKDDSSPKELLERSQSFYDNLAEIDNSALQY